MKKILKHIASIALLCSVCYLGGEWQEETPRNKVIHCDGTALATALICGL